MKRIKIIALVLLLFFLGFFREFLFENINSHLYYLWKGENNPNLPSSLLFLQNFEYWTLYYAKFFLIAVFTGIYLLVSILLVSQFFREKAFRNITIAFFIGVFAFSGIIFSVGYLLGSGHEAYGISRKLIEFVQSPLACFFLIPAFALYKNDRLSQ